MLPSLKQQIVLCTRMQWVMGVVAGVGLVAFYTLAYRPVAARAAVVEAEHSAALAQLATNIEQTRDLGKLAVEVETQRARLLSSKTIPAVAELPQLVRDLNQLGRDAQVRGLRYEPGVEKPDDLYNETPIVLSFQGEFTGVCDFLRQVQSLPRLTRQRKLSLKSLDGKQGLVDAKLTLNVYRKEQS